MVSVPQVWLITGCSTGFGAQFVHSLIARGDKVIATGRDADRKLEHLKPTGAAILELDLTCSETEIRSKADSALEIFGSIDVVVNNAGYSELGFLEEVT